MLNYPKEMASIGYPSTKQNSDSNINEKVRTALILKFYWRKRCIQIRTSAAVDPSYGEYPQEDILIFAFQPLLLAYFIHPLLLIRKILFSFLFYFLG